MQKQVCISMQNIKQFQKKILKFYKAKGRNLPWRKTTNPYFILLSEIMLQQTQVDRVITYFNTWTKKWPTIQHLAHAQRSTVLKMWMGLGYNNRAINLHKAAQKISKDYAGDVLTAVQNFKEIPGIGPYTSKAVQIFAANRNEVTVDTNIRRIFIHEFKIPESTPDKELWKLAEQCLPTGKSRDWHNALMDYGATFLTSRKTGIKPKTQQSAFEGSDRQIRAKVLRYLLKNKQASHKQLHEVSKNADLSRLKRILAKMMKDELIKIQKKRVLLNT